MVVVFLTIIVEGLRVGVVSALQYGEAIATVALTA